jgi:predicted dehydrogenase
MTETPDSSGAPRVLVVGAGSAGRRHTKLLSDLGCRVHIIDPDLTRANALAREVGGTVIPSGAEWADEWSGVVIASPSSFHAEQGLRASDAGTRVLIEKPLATSPDAALGLIAPGRNIAVAYNLRFAPPVQWVVGAVRRGSIGEPVSASVWFGQYLPDWRPDTDHRASYSARSELGGGILLDASHEIDLLCWLFGGEPWTVPGAVVERRSDVTVDADDSVAALLVSPDGVPVTTSLDMLSRRYRRGVEVVGTEATARLDWAKGRGELESGTRVEAFEGPFDIGESYRAQARASFEWFAGGPPLPANARSGLEVVGLCAQIREAANRSTS